jgi:hypothetical protein
MNRKSAWIVIAGLLLASLVIGFRYLIFESGGDVRRIPVKVIGPENPVSSKPKRTLPLHQPRLGDLDRKRFEADPLAAISENPNNLDLIVAWAAIDPEAAMKWCDSADHQMSRVHLLGAIATGIIIHDGPEAMKRFIDAHQQDPQLLPKHQGDLLAYTFFNLGREDTIDTALNLLRDAGDQRLAGMMVLGVPGTRNEIRAIDYLEANGIPVKVDYWAFQAAIGEDPRYWADWTQQRDSDLLPEIIQGWARDHPGDARTWIEQRVPVNDPKREEIEGLLAP